MHALEEHARQMRQRIYRHMLQTRGWKYKAFLRYLRLFRYVSFTPKRGEFLESYYTLMRYLDDVVDGDAPLPDGFANPADYILQKIRFSQNPSQPVDEADYMLLHCYRVAEKFGEQFREETADILHSLLFDARRRNQLQVFPAAELMQHFHRLDIRGTIRATLKIFREDPEKYIYLEPLGTASRYQYDLEDFDADIKAGYVNIPAEDCETFGIGREELLQPGHPSVKAWLKQHAQQGMELLREHHRLLPGGKFSWLARASFPLVYEKPAKKIFRQVLAEKIIQPVSKVYAASA